MDFTHLSVPPLPEIQGIDEFIDEAGAVAFGLGAIFIHEKLG